MELKRIDGLIDGFDELLETINLITFTLQGLKEEY